MSTTDSPKNRPDGATPEPETDGLNEYLLELHDSFLDVNRAIGRAECARLKLLSVAYAMAEARTEIDTAAGTHSISREDVFHANLRSMIANLSASSNESDIGLTNRAYQAHRLTTEFAIWMPEMESGEVSLRHANGMLRHAVRCLRITATSSASRCSSMPPPHTRADRIIREAPCRAPRHRTIRGSIRS